MDQLACDSCGLVFSRPVCGIRLANLTVLRLVDTTQSCKACDDTALPLFFLNTEIYPTLLLGFTD